MVVKGTRPRGVCLHGTPAGFLFPAFAGGGSLVQSYFGAVLKDLNFVLDQKCFSQS